VANLPLAFFELVTGGIMLTAGLSGDTVANVVEGNITYNSFGTSAAAGNSTSVPTNGVTGEVVPTTGSAAVKVKAMQAMAKLLNGKPYIWGGGHSNFGIAAGYDCSGFVSAILHSGGFLSSPQTTQTLPGQPGIASGIGKYVTIYDRTDASGNDHVIINLDGQWWESGGGEDGGSPDVHSIATPDSSYLGSFNTILHPVGL
jgi:hypothetical protein